MRFERSAGILLHPTSLPGKYGIGDLGKEAYNFLDFMESAGQKLWQVFPLGPTGYGDSPYQCFSAFAGNPLIISPDILLEEGFLKDDDLKNIPDFNPNKIDFGELIRYKHGLLKKSFEHFKNDSNGKEKPFEEVSFYNANFQRFRIAHPIFTHSLCTQSARASGCLLQSGEGPEQINFRSRF